jgi:flagellar biosynthesis/type III secretory pathway M-ring protein FliF/YscJ
MLSRDALVGIRTFVAGAVTGLDPRRVALLDDRGVALSDTIAGAEQAVELQASLQSALDAAFGADATIVRVRVGYDPRQREIRDARREPLGTHAIVSSRSDEHYTSDKKHYTKFTTNEDRGSRLHEERTSLAPGAADRISVAILIDAARSLDARKIREIAAATVGAQSSRGDVVTVHAVPFHRSVQKPGTLRTAALGYAASFAPMLVFVCAGLIALRLLARPFFQWLVAASGRAGVRTMRAALEGVAPGQVRASLAGEPPHTVAAVLSGLSGATAAAVLASYDGDARARILQYMAQPLPPVARDAHALLTPQA